LTRCLAIARSQAIAGNAVNSLALVKYALDQCKAAMPALSSQDEEQPFAPRNIQVTNRDMNLLHDTLTGELQRGRALVEIFNQNKAPHTPQSATTGSAKPLSSRLSDYPPGGVDLDNIVVYPPRLEPFPVKPLFLDVAWNYIEYPYKREETAMKETAMVQEKGGSEAEAKPQKRGWFGFGR
jgi:signal recognition particle subunit SRP68